MANITFVIDDALLREIKAIAAHHDTSVNALVRNYFSNVVASGVQETNVLNGNLKTLFDYSVGRISRHRAKAFLGTDDATFSNMLRETGFPPPRASQDDENAMLEEIKGVRFG